ncbi:MAG: hypothetical protein AAB553_02325 [Patescibacteria group bacterium]
MLDRKTKNKKKCFLYFFLYAFLFLFFIPFTIPVYAAGETYTWVNGSIQLSGGDVTTQKTLTGSEIASGGQTQYGPEFMRISPAGGECDINIAVRVPTGNTATGVLTATSGISQPNNMGCNQDIVNTYNGKSVTIGGNQAEGREETAAERIVTLLLISPETDTAPASITITVNNVVDGVPRSGSFTANKEIKETRSGNGIDSAYYTFQYTISPGEMQICADAIIECETATKLKYTPLFISFGQTKEQRMINVTVEAIITHFISQSCQSNGLTVELKQNNEVKQTVQTDPIEITADTENTEFGGEGALSETTKSLKVTFENVDPGTYQVCIAGTTDCQGVILVEGQLPANGHTATVQTRIENGADICEAPGGSVFEKKENIIPPPPPCADLRDGKCWAVATSFFGLDVEGLFYTDPEELIVQVFSILLSISGGLCLLILIIGFYRVIISRGKPEALKAAQEQIQAAIVGALFLTASFLMLEVIGIDILKIPGWTL